MLGIFLIPVLYVVFQWLREKAEAGVWSSRTACEMSRRSLDVRVGSQLAVNGPNQHVLFALVI